MATATIVTSLLRGDAAGSRSEQEPLTLSEEARLLVEALQNDLISEDELLKVANSKPDPYSPDAAERFAQQVRARKLFQQLDLNSDGVVSADELLEVKGRLYKRPAVTGLGTTNTLAEERNAAQPPFLRNDEAVAAIYKTASTYLTHRRGYGLCCLHFAFFGVVMAVLTLQQLTGLEYESRAAINRALFPEEVFGTDLTMETSALLDTKADVLQWIDTTFTGAGGVFADPSCGNGECDAPVETPAWRDGDDQHGGECSIDCGIWDTAKRRRSARVQLKVDSTLEETEVSKIRWNLFCPEVRQYEEQVQYYAENQNITRANATFDVDKTAYLFDCDWQLRVYAPVGGVAGTLTYNFEPQNSTAIVYSAVDSGTTSIKLRAGKTSYSWEACHGATTDLNTLIGNIRVCSNNAFVLFNRTHFGNLDAQAKITELAAAQLQAWIVDANQPVYYNIAPSCGPCAGPGVMNECTGEPCPSFAYESSTGECPTLCFPGQTNGTAHSAAAVADACPSTTTQTTTTPTPPGVTSSNVFSYQPSPSAFYNPAPSDTTATERGNSGTPGIVSEFTTMLPTAPKRTSNALDSLAGASTSQIASTQPLSEASTTMQSLTFTASEATSLANTPAPAPRTTPFARRLAEKSRQLGDDTYMYNCAFQVKSYDVESLNQAIYFQLSGFVVPTSTSTTTTVDYDNYIFPDPVCVELQVKIGTDNSTERDFVVSVFGSHSVNESNVSVAAVDIDIESELGTVMAVSKESQTEPLGSVCDTSKSCVAAGVDAGLMVSYLDEVIGSGNNPCTFLRQTYNCHTDGCGCPYRQCQELAGCGGKSCDSFMWDSCQNLEESAGCDCSGCVCSTGASCPASCMGLTCADLQAISMDDVGYIFENPDAAETPPETRKLKHYASYQWLETAFGCDCSGCPDQATPRNLRDTDGTASQDGLKSRIEARVLQARSLQGNTSTSGFTTPVPTAPAGDSYPSNNGGGYSFGYNRAVYTDAYNGWWYANWYGWYADFAFYDYWIYYGYGYYDSVYNYGPSASYNWYYTESTGSAELTRADKQRMSATWPLDESNCDATAETVGECTLELLLNGVCDRVCATARCGWDFADCCNPLFAGATKSLATESDTTLIILRMDNDDETPFSSNAVPMPRYVANAHRLVGGLLLDQTRMQLGNCSAVKAQTMSSSVGSTVFSASSHVKNALSANPLCETESLETSPIGSDPVFARRSSLFDSELDAQVCHGNDYVDVPGFPFVRFPSSSAFAAPGRSWGASVSQARATTQEPGFFNVSGKDNVVGGYPVFFDNSFNQERASRYLQYITDGFFIDEQYTSSLELKILLYNEATELATFVKGTITAADSGQLRLTKSVTMFRPDQYGSGNSLRDVEVFFELVYILFIAVSIIEELVEFVSLCKAKRRCLAYFESYWNYVDIAAIIAQIAAVFMWMNVQAAMTEEAFAPRLQYFVYEPDSNCPLANLARFNNSEVTELRLLYATAEHLMQKKVEYQGVANAVFTLMFLQMLKALHFQPRLSLITKTFEVAGAQLVNFLILFVLVLFTFAMMGNVIFGSTIDDLSSYASAQLTMLYILFGGTDVGSNLATVYGFSGIFFYFLFIIFASMLLMNMLLAILVDAYIAVKTQSFKERGVFKDIMLQTKASIKAMVRPTDVLSNAEVKEKFEKLTRRPTPQRLTKPSVPLGAYEVTAKDARRILHRWIESEEISKKIKTGLVSEQGAAADVDKIAASLLYHHSIFPKSASNARLAPVSSRNIKGVSYAKQHVLHSTNIDAEQVDIEASTLRTKRVAFEHQDRASMSRAEEQPADSARARRRASVAL